MRVLLSVLLFCFLAGPVNPASAHSASTAYVNIDAAGSALSVKWSIALRDLDDAVGLDDNGDGNLTWGEVKGHFGAIDAYALSRLVISADGAPCGVGPVDHAIDRFGDGAYAVLRFTATCDRHVGRIAVDYRFLFDLDPQHRGLLSLTTGQTVHALALSPDQPHAEFDVTPDLPATAISFFMAGVVHLVTGLDHILFIAMLLTPAILGQGPVSQWAGLRRLAGPAFLETVKVLSAFTVAHAMTLSLSVLQIIHIPARFSETGIAITILVTALDNILHVLPRQRWPLAFFFGLIHGLGFANALGPLSLPPATLALALVSFNLGLEAVQVGIAAVVLPLARIKDSKRSYVRYASPTISVAVAAAAFA